MSLFLGSCYFFFYTHPLGKANGQLNNIFFASHCLCAYTAKCQVLWVLNTETQIKSWTLCKGTKEGTWHTPPVRLLAIIPPF